MAATTSAEASLADSSGQVLRRLATAARKPHDHPCLRGGPDGWQALLRATLGGAQGLVGLRSRACLYSKWLSGVSNRRRRATCSMTRTGGTCSKRPRIMKKLVFALVALTVIIIALGVGIMLSSVVLLPEQLTQW